MVGLVCQVCQVAIESFSVANYTVRYAPIYAPIGRGWMVLARHLKWVPLLPQSLSKYGADFCNRRRYVPKHSRIQSIAAITTVPP